jgi:hypothetical protein
VKEEKTPVAMSTNSFPEIINFLAMFIMLMFAFQFWQMQNNATLHYSATVAEYGNFVGQFTDFKWKN